MADIRFHCRACGQKLAVDSSAAGWEIRCPQCGASQTAPGPTPEQKGVPESSAAALDTKPAVPEFAARAPTGGEEFEYEAFISYRHVEPDRRFAKWLHTALETYRVPRALVRERGLSPSLKKIFRDEEELPASADLSKEIQSALRRSRFLVVVCSPRTPPSQWVDAEVAYFRALGRHDQILALLIEGEPGESFPPSLREIRRTVVKEGKVRQTVEEVEPLAADVRPTRNEGQRQVRHLAKLRILASLLGIPFDHLRQREKQRQRRKTAVVALALTIAIVSVAAGGGALLHQRALLRHAEELRGEHLDMDRVRAEQRAVTQRPPPFVEAEPQWQPLDESYLERRKLLTRDLPTYRVGEMLALLAPPEGGPSAADKAKPTAASLTGNRGEQTQDDNAATNAIPQVFLLKGHVAGVRQVEEQAFVFLRDGKYPIESFYSRSLTEPKPLRPHYRSRQKDQVAPLACIVLEGRNVVPNMADYRVGDMVTLVVERRDWTGAKPEGTPLLASIRGGPVDESPYWREFCKLGDTFTLFWCCVGRAIEKADKPNTWVEPKPGRAAILENEETLKRSFSAILREPDRFVGTRGLLEAKFAGVWPLFPKHNWKTGYWSYRGASNSEPVRVILKVQSVEGPISVIADVGPNSMALEFADYAYGATVEADITILGTFEQTELLWPLPVPTSPDEYAPPRPAVDDILINPKKRPYRQLLSTDPLATPLSVKCEWIQMKGEPSTLVFAQGPRRQGTAGRIGNAWVPLKPVSTPLYDQKATPGQHKEPLWTNSLGMRFIPVPGTKVLFSIWETRFADYMAYAQATGGGDREWKLFGFSGTLATSPQPRNHPVTHVSWKDAEAFCEWLTQKERDERRITSKQFYRLPTDSEWSTAVGLAKEKGATPKDRNGRVRGLHPWGPQAWPPHGAGNYCSNFRADDFEFSSPVGSFAPNQFGLYDLGGNVTEWCQDKYSPTAAAGVIRDASFRTSDSDDLLSSNRGWDSFDRKSPDRGFRVVLAKKSWW